MIKTYRSFALLAASSVALAACAGGSLVNPFTNQPITPAQVQAAAVTACNFQPSINTVTNLLTNNGQNAQTAEAVAALICNAVIAKAGSRKFGVSGPISVKVNGVTITGSFKS